jgi:hypothetical protein
MSSPIDATVWCLFLLAVFLMLIISKLVPETVARFYAKKRECRKNLKKITYYLKNDSKNQEFEFLRNSEIQLWKQNDFDICYVYAI